AVYFRDCFKHAFENREKGKIKVSAEHDSEGDLIILRVSDNTRGLPGEFIVGNSGKLGTRLISQLTKQLDGELSAYNDGGAVVEISFRRSGKTGPGNSHLTDR
ncbi:MAG: hypothetical protein R3281_07880, partial [Balneolaceae bacterium]|nr:hypothetical protein [Balneolaceae bacterium]